MSVFCTARLAQHLRYFTAVLLLGCFLAGGAKAGESLGRSDDEHGMLHLKLDLSAVRGWAGDTLSSEPLKTNKPLLVVHIFSLDCPPCLTELPKLKDLFRPDLKDIDFALVLETLDSARIREFLRRNRDSLPRVKLYLNTDRRLRSTSQLNIETVPITLLLDNQQVVHQAFVGSLEGRAHIFGAALNRLARALNHQPQPLDAGSLLSGPLQRDQLLHQSAPPLLTRMPSRQGRTHLGQARAAVQVLYLFGAGCSGCTEDMDDRLRRIVRGFTSEKDVQFALLNCGAEDGSSPMPAPTRLSSHLVYPCKDRTLQALWAHERRPITLVLDSEQIIRDAFLGSTKSSVGIAIRRLLGASH